MKTKYCLMAVMMFMSASLTAQETYQDTKLIDNDLNGTAPVCRYGWRFGGAGCGYIHD